MKKLLTSVAAISALMIAISQPAKAITPVDLMIAWGGGLTLMVIDAELFGRDGGPFGKGFPDADTKVIGTHQGRPVYEHDDDKSWGVVMDDNE